MEAEELNKLIKISKEAVLKAYCPYSNFSVGAALLCEDGRIFSGCNVENASYGLTICAERTVIVKAISEGSQKFKAIFVTTSSESDEYIGPCGACRQFLAEFGTDWDVYICKQDGTYLKHKVAELLPYAFTPATLKRS